MLRHQHTRRILQTAILACSSLVPTGLASAADKVWNHVGAGTWGTGSNWSPNGMPQPGDDVFLGDPFLITNGQCYLNTSPIVNSVALTNGMMLDTKGFIMQVGGTTKVETFLTNWSQIMLRDGVNPFDLHTRDLLVSGAASRIWAVDNPTIFVTGKATFGPGTSLFGGAVMNFTGDVGPVLVMDGKFDANANSSWTLNQLGTGRIDLDGTTIHDTLLLTGGSSGSWQQLTVNGTQLHDDFDDIVWLGTGNKLNMNLSQGWTLGGNGKILYQFWGEADPGEINGGTMTVHGTIEFEDAPLSTTVTNGEINAPVIFNQAADVLVGGRDTLDINSNATIHGGNFLLSGQGNNRINFNGPTEINGGTFTTNSGYTNSFINFNGTTDWSGTININGDARQNGNAVVNATTVINADILDMDGATSLTKWDINAPLTINADSIDLTDNIMSGTIDIHSQFLAPASLTVNLPGDDKWIAGGRMNVTGSGVGVSTTLLGADVGIAGELYVTKANAFSARVDFELGSLTTINADSSLYLNSGSVVDPNTIAGATITGPGKLRSGAGRAIVGFGTIATGIDFDDDAKILAKGGTLTITGAVEAVGIIGTNNGTSTLVLPAGFNSNVADALELNGGTVAGLSLVNGGLTRGKGAITTSFLNNSGIISPESNGTLVINTGFLPDLDGSTETGIVNVLNGNLHVVDQLADAFNGTINLREGRTLNMQGGMTIGLGGQLNIGDAGSAIAHVDAPSLSIAGAVNLQASTQTYVDADTTFQPTSVTTFGPGFSSIAFYQDATITSGATFVTPGATTGEIYTGASGRLHLANGAIVDASVYNNGTLNVAGSAAGTATVETLFQSEVGRTELTLLGPAVGTQHDRINVTKSADLKGTLGLSTGAYDPAYLVPHEVVHADMGVNEPFQSVSGMVLSPTKYLAVTYDADSVLVTAALPGDANLDGSVNIADFAILGANFNNLATWSAGDFNGDAVSDIGDFALLTANFNFSVPTELPRGASVPEPTGALCGAVLLAASAPAIRPRRRQK